MERYLLFHTVYGCRKHRLYPRWKLRTQTVVDPLSLTPVENHTRFPQKSEMARDFRLNLVQRMGQFTDTQFPFPAQQEKNAQAREVAEYFEQLIRRHIHMRIYTLI